MTNFEKWKADMKDKGITPARLYLATTCADCPAFEHCNGDNTTIHCIESFLHWANKEVEK